MNYCRLRSPLVDFKLQLFNTRRNDNLHTPVGRTEAIYETFSFYGVHIWNHISSNIQIDVSYTSFKCIVKTYIQNNNITIFRLNF